MFWSSKNDIVTRTQIMRLIFIFQIGNPNQLVFYRLNYTGRVIYTPRTDTYQNIAKPLMQNNWKFQLILFLVKLEFEAAGFRL